MAAGPAASITDWMAYSAVSRVGSKDCSESGQWKNSTSAKSEAQGITTREWGRSAATV